MVNLTLAGPAEILRAKQKDDSHSDRLQKWWLDIFLKSSETHLWLRLRKIPVGRLLYETVTTLSGFQTLGEEYTGIILVDSSRYKTPKFLNRLIMLVLDNFGSTILFCILNWLKKEVEKDKHVLPKAKQDISEMIKLLKSVLPFLERCHRTLLYCGGLYYQISKRITGTQYVLKHRLLKDYHSSKGFKLLGFTTAIHLVVIAIHMTLKWLSSPAKVHSSIAEPSTSSTLIRKCPLCLEERNRVSVTTCGHLFCWSCILKWLQEQNQCPICRERIKASRIIPLQNYL